MHTAAAQLDYIVVELRRCVSCADVYPAETRHLRSSTATVLLCVYIAVQLYSMDFKRSCSVDILRACPAWLHIAASHVRRIPRLDSAVQMAWLHVIL